MNSSNLPTSWFEFITNQKHHSYFASLSSYLIDEYKQHICYPPKNEIFRAFELCPLEKVKVVIIGQDPYHGPGQAHGLCFSVNDGVKKPPSLVNIFKELESDIKVPIPSSGNLTRWAEQGVLMLNAVLTVRKSSPGSHANKGWEVFTDAVIEHINEQCENVIFLLWGGYAQKKGKKIDTHKHLILKSGHPSPLSANRGHWFGNQCFSKTNAYLKSVGKIKIEW